MITPVNEVLPITGTPGSSSSIPLSISPRSLATLA